MTTLDFFVDFVSERTARKLHTCCHCRTTIYPGQRYIRAVAMGRPDGLRSWRTYKVHKTCDRLYSEIDKYVSLGHYGWLYEIWGNPEVQVVVWAALPVVARCLELLFRPQQKELPGQKRLFEKRQEEGGASCG